MWNADEDVPALVRDYCERFYGPGADAVEKYMWTLEDAVEATPIMSTWGRVMPWRLIVDEETRAELEGYMSEAEAATADAGEPIGERIAMLRIVHDHFMAAIAVQDALARGEFETALAHVDRMLALRDDADAIEPAMLPHTSDYRRGFRTSTEWRRDMTKRMADKTNGVEGKLVQLLPKDWRFRTDPEAIGNYYRWYDCPLDENWTSIDTTIPWEWQGWADEKGWGYWGNAWYRLDFELTEEQVKEKLWLTIGAVYNREVWIWLNGELLPWAKDAHYRLGYHDVRTPIHVDISGAAKPGVNTLAVRVKTEPPGRNPRSGIHQRSILWIPNDPEWKSPHGRK
jgi:hypothetical protein